MSHPLVGANILKRAIEHMCDGPFDPAREDALNILNGAIEQCFAAEAPKRNSPTPKQVAYLFFLRNAGYSYNPKTETKLQGRARTARRLAKAERDARALGYTFAWEDDWTIGDHQKEYDCYADGGPDTCETCTMYDTAGKAVQSLGCIDDASREYRRVIEAELALEQLG